jgi:hypothetical protein
MYNNYYETLLRRVEILEQLYFEGARDDLKKYLGDDLYNDYMKIRNKISDTEWKDFGKVQKKDLSDIRDYVDNFQSKSDVKKQDKSEGAELIYNKNGWKVYRITTYKAAQLYGKGTKWCITGRYDGEEERGQHYFDVYIKTRKLDGGYYFYIADDGDKYCVLKKKDGTIDSIWMANDERTSSANILEKRPDFPSVPNVLEFNEIPDEEKEIIISKAVKKCRVDLKDYLNLYYDDSCAFGKTSIKGDTAKFNFSVKLFFSDAKIKGTISLVYKSPIAFDLNYSFIDSDKKLNNGKDISGTIKNIAVFEHSSEGDDEILYEDFFGDLSDADDNLR